jgi:glycosyltransferase involved in cell wall biosynthesis/GT2 family glycosyltransferase
VDGAHLRSGVCDFDLEAPIDDLEVVLQGLVTDGYDGVRVLAKRGSIVLGELELPLDAADPAATAHLIAQAAHEEFDARDIREIAAASSDALISVAVPTCGDLEELGRCLEALRQQEYDNFEVLVCDNRPGKPETRVFVDGLASEDARFKWIPAFEAGSSAARNAGLWAAAGEFVAFADDDTTPAPNWLSTIASTFAEDESVRCVTGLVLPTGIESDAQRWFESRGAYVKGYERRRFSLGAREDQGPLFPYELGVYGTGANFAFNREFLQAMGGFDTSLGLGTPSAGGEDLDLFLATLFAGGTIVYEPSAYVRHPSHLEYEALTRQMHAYGSGLAAVVTKWAVVGSARRRLITVVPRGAAHLIGNFRKATEVRVDSFDSTPILSAETRGMLAGPARWLGGRLSKRRRARIGAAREREFDFADMVSAKAALNVIHVNVAPRAKASVDGIKSALTAQADALLAAGHQVTVMGSAASNPQGSRHVPADGVVGAVKAMRAELRSNRPDVVHIHSMFRPAHVVLGWILRRASVPYVVQPHSALGPRAMERYRVRKYIWMVLCERRFIDGAEAIVCLTETERDEAHAVNASKFAAVVPNPLDKNEVAESFRWSQPKLNGSRRPTALTLCRFDVTQKGLDRIARYASLVPEMEFVVHGQADHNEPELLEALRDDMPSNMQLADPVYGEDKYAALTACSIYLQPSRWEGLSISVCEAFSLGTPVGVSTELGEMLPTSLAAGSVVLDADFDVAARQLREFLAEGPDTAKLDDAARWVSDAMSPAVVASELAAVYSTAVLNAR